MSPAPGTQSPLIVPWGAADVPRLSMVQGWLPSSTALAPALLQATAGTGGWLAAPGSEGPRLWSSGPVRRWSCWATSLALGSPPLREGHRPKSGTGSGGPEAVQKPPCWARKALEKRGAPRIGGSPSPMTFARKAGRTRWKRSTRDTLLGVLKGG